MKRRTRRKIDKLIAKLAKLGIVLKSSEVIYEYLHEGPNVRYYGKFVQVRYVEDGLKREYINGVKAPYEYRFDYDKYFIEALEHLLEGREIERSIKV